MFLSLFIWFASLVLKVLKEQIARIFTQDYKELKQMYPAPLYTWRFLSGVLQAKREGFLFKAALKLDVYKDMLIVSAHGKGLCLHYDQCVLKHKRKFLFHHLVFKNLPVQEKSTTPSLIELSDWGQFTDLEIVLSVKKINILLKQAQQEENSPAKNA